MEAPTNIQGFLLLLLLYKDIRAIKKKKSKLFNHQLTTVIHMCKSKEIPGILTITSFLLHFFYLLGLFFFKDDFYVEMENNLNDNVFRKRDTSSAASVTSSSSIQLNSPHPLRPSHSTGLFPK